MLYVTRFRKEDNDKNSSDTYHFSSGLKLFADNSCKECADKHAKSITEGRIDIASDPDHGTVWKVYQGDTLLGYYYTDSIPN